MWGSQEGAAGWGLILFFQFNSPVLVIYRGYNEFSVPMGSKTPNPGGLVASVSVYTGKSITLLVKGVYRNPVWSAWGAAEEAKEIRR